MLSITFIGHAKMHYTQDVEDLLMDVLEELIEGEKVTFYMGINGNFDALAKKCCLQYKKKHKNAKLFFVTPYLDEAYFKNLDTAIKDFDEIIYPNLENVPKRYAICARNKYMINQSEILIAFASYVFGNAHKYIYYALSKRKECINLGEKIFQGKRLWS